MNFVSAMSAVAAIPCPLASPSTTASSPSGRLEEVVDVTTDLDAGRRLVDGADLEPFDLGEPAREQRALHGVGEVLPLLGKARVVDGERRLPGDEDGSLDLLVSEPPSRIERDDRQRGQQLGRGCDRDDEHGRALLEERGEELVRLTETPRYLPVDHEGLVRELPDRLLALEHGAQRLEPRVGHVRRARDEQCASPVEHPDHGRVGIEQLDGRGRDRVECRVERQALGERARDLVQRPEPLGRLALGGDRLLELGRLALGPLVKLRVLRGHGQLGGERRQERQLVRLHLPPARQVDGEESNELLARDERDCERGVDLRFGHGRTHGSEPDVGLRIRNVKHALGAHGPERELEEAFGDGELGIGAGAGLRSQPVRVAEVDRDTVRSQELGDARNGGLQRVRKRELGDGLAENREQRVGPFELE